MRTMIEIKPKSNHTMRNPCKKNYLCDKYAKPK